MANEMLADPRGPITREAVVEAAIAIIDEGGLQKLTMRSLAERLDVYPTTIYWHAGNKQQLIALVCQRILDNIQLQAFPGKLTWEQWIMDAGSSIRAELRRHPNIIPVLASQVQVSPSSFGMVNSFLSLLEAAGFRQEDIPDLYNSVISGIFGWVFSEFASPPRSGSTGWQENFKRTLEDTDPDDFPTLHRFKKELANRSFMLRWSSALESPMDSGFHMTLRVLVAGLRAMHPDSFDT